MRNVAIVASMFLSTFGWQGMQPASAQNACYYNYQACGYAPGYFRPQGLTVNRYIVPQYAPPGSWYAPVGPNGGYWRQWNSGAGYGPQEPNPYSNNGYLMNPYRVTRHVWTTRIQPRIAPYGW
jgi:hypothetical protein